MTHRCVDIRESLSAYIDNELPAARQAVLATHLAACASCREEMATLRHMETLLTTWDVAPLPARTVARFADALAARRKKRHLAAPLAWSTAAALALLVFLVVQRPQEPPRQFALVPVAARQVDQHVDNHKNTASLENRLPMLPFAAIKSYKALDIAAATNPRMSRGKILNATAATLISIPAEDAINASLQETNIERQNMIIGISGSDETMTDRLAETKE